MQNLFNMDSQKKILLLSIAAFVVLYVIVANRTPTKDFNPNSNATRSADTYIPPGHVLVPIQIDNNSSIDGLISEFAVVDLYGRSKENTTELVASQVKLIRAPLNPNQFAVLATESQSRQIMQITAPFWVVLQNRNHVAANLEKNLLTKKMEQKEIEKPIVAPVAKTKSVPNTRLKIAIEYYEKKL